MFITFEGTEGSGKTSQAAVLSEALKAYVPVLLTREPGGTWLGEQIRPLLLSAHSPRLDVRAQLLLLAAARAQLVQEVLTPALSRGETVVCVRYVDSTRAYQGGGEGIPEAEIEAAIALATGGLEPDLTLYLDLDITQGLLRREQARDEGTVGPAEGWNSFDARELEFHQRVRRAYQEVALRYPDRVVTVNASLPFGEVAGEIQRLVLHRLNIQPHF